MTRTATATKPRAKPHARAKADKRIGHAARAGDPWAARIREAVIDACHPWQRDAVLDPARLFAWLVGRGGGKTTAYKARFLIEMAETTRGRFVFGAPTLGMAVELLWDPLKETCTELGIMDDCEWKEAPREGGKILTLKRTGSRLKLFGADDKKQINLLRGQPFNGVGCDEIAYWPSPEIVDNFVRKVIQPRIGERNGWIGLASSPGPIPRGLFFEVTAEDSPRHRPYRDRELPEHAGWRGWSSHAWALRDVVALPDAERRYPALCALRRSHLEIKEIERWGDDNPIWLREYEGRWARDDTVSVFRFDPKLNLWAPSPGATGLALLKAAIAKLPAGCEWHFVLGVDKGSPRILKDGGDNGKRDRNDPWAVNGYAFSPADPERRIFHTYFLERTGLYARPIAQLLLGEDQKSPTGCMPHDAPGGILGIIGWPDGMVMDADTSTIEELANVYGLRFVKAEKRPDYKVGAFELTNGDLVDGRIKAIEDSPLHRQLVGLQWVEQDSGALKEDPAQPNHSTDTLIYARKLIAKLFESGVVEQEDRRAGPDTGRSSGYVDPMGLGGDEGDLPGGNDSLFDAWLRGQSDDEWGMP